MMETLISSITSITASFSSDEAEPTNAEPTNNKTLESRESSLSLASTATSSSSNKSVGWGNIHIRQYNRTVGDHPDVVRGPPMALAWDYVEHGAQPLDQFEALRSHQGEQPRRLSSKYHLRLTAKARRALLAEEFGVPSHELDQASAEAQLVREQRAESQQEGESLRDKFDIQRKPLVKKGSSRRSTNSQGKSSNKGQRKGRMLRLFRR